MQPRQWLVLWNKANQCYTVSTPDASGTTKYSRSHYNQGCCLQCMLRGLSFRRRLPLLFFIRHLYLSVAQLFTERSLLHIMSRHAPYCWLAKSLFRYSAPIRVKMTYPTFNNVWILCQLENVLINSKSISISKYLRMRDFWFCVCGCLSCLICQ